MWVQTMTQRVAFWLGAFFLGGCATTPDPAGVGAGVDSTASPPGSGALVVGSPLMTLTVAPVHSALPLNPYDPRLTGHQFREALIARLRKSRMFHRVTADPDGDYRLEASIIRHEAGDSHTQGSKAHLWVNYTLINNRTNSVVWRGQRCHEYFWREVSASTDPVELFELQLRESPILPAL